jgi:hypothetical protein
MVCVTVRKGFDCTFMSNTGCGFTGGRCFPVIDKCEGCGRTLTVEDGVVCAIAPNPGTKWAAGSCNFATHLQRKVVEETQKLNPLKASKRGAGKKK